VNNFLRQYRGSTDSKAYVEKMHGRSSNQPALSCIVVTRIHKLYCVYADAV